MVSGECEGAIVVVSNKHPLKTMKGLIGAVLGAIVWLLATGVLDIYGKSQAPVMSFVHVILGVVVGAITVGTILGSSGKPRRRALSGALIGLVVAVVVGMLSNYSVLQLIAMAALWAIVGAYLFQVRSIFD